MVVFSLSLFSAPGREHPKTDDDLACDKIQEYAVSLQNELALLEAQVETWLSKEKSLSSAWSELGSSVAMVAQSEGSGRASNIDDRHDSTTSVTDYVPPPMPTTDSSTSFTSFTPQSLGLGGDPELSRLLSLLGSSSDTLGLMLSKKEVEENLEFREPLKDAQRTALAVEHMLKRRTTCLQEFHHLLDDLEHARSKLVTAQGTPGKEGKLPALEAIVTNAESAAETKRFELAQMTVAVRSEFQRSQNEKSHALSQIVRTFIRLQLEHSLKVSNIWKDVLKEAESNQQQQPSTSAE